MVWVWVWVWVATTQMLPLQTKAMMTEKAGRGAKNKAVGGLATLKKTPGGSCRVNMCDRVWESGSLGMDDDVS